MRWRSCSCVLVLFAFVVPNVVGQANKEVSGSHITVELVSGTRAVLNGELIAVDPDSLWLLTETGLVGAPLGYVRGASMRRHSMNGVTGLVWTLVGGLVTGGLLSGACASVSDDCGGVFVGSMFAWTIVGGVSALSMEVSSRRTVRPPNIDGQLVGYARFPQGMPPGLDRNSLGLKVAVRSSIPPPF